MSFAEINNAMAILVAKKVQNDEVVKVSWLAAEVALQYPHIEGEDSDLYRYVFLKHLGTVAKRCVTKFAKAGGDDPKQHMIAGFEYIQAAYSLDRDGERVLVPVSQATDEELLMRAGEMRNMSQGNLNHAVELEELVKLRRETLSKDQAA